MAQNDFTDNADIKHSSCIKALTMSLMAVSTAQSFLSTAWHPVPQTPLITVCKLTVQIYHVSRFDYPWIARQGIHISGKNQFTFTKWEIMNTMQAGVLCLRNAPKDM